MGGVGVGKREGGEQTLPFLLLSDDYKQHFVPCNIKLGCMRYMVKSTPYIVGPLPLINNQPTL